MGKTRFAVMLLSLATLANSSGSANAQQGKYTIGVRANTGNPPNPNAAYGAPMIWGELADVDGYPYYGITVHGTLSLPKTPANPNNGASMYRVMVKDVYHESSDTHAAGYSGVFIAGGYWTTPTEVWWSGTFLTAWSGMNGFGLPAGTITVTFALEVSLPDTGWIEVATCTGGFDW